MIYDPVDTKFKSIVGAVPCDKQIKFRVNTIFDSVIFVVQKEGENICKYKMNKIDGLFELQLSFTRGLYFYYFELPNGKYISLSNDYVGEISDEIKLFQLSVFDSDYIVPDWLKGGIIYQIFPDRFYSSKKELPQMEDRVFHVNKNETPIYSPNDQGEVLNNDFFGGDLAGIIEKLDYLKDLNVTAIYLNPIFRAYSNHRYDTGNYLEIDSLLCTKQELINLIEKANSLGIKIILDGVFNHTGANSLYFNKYNKYDSVGAFQSKESKYFDWYDFTDYPKYNSWWGIQTLPAVNKSENSPFIEYICGNDGVLQFYTKLGVYGWRLDVVDELPSHFVQRIKKAVKSVNKDAIVIGEVWEDASNKIAYGTRREYFLGKELDSVMNYPLKNAIISFVKEKDAKKLVFTIKQLIDHYPKDVLNSLMNILATHDTFRVLSALANRDVSSLSKDEMAKIELSKEELNQAVFNLKIASLLQFTLPGVPSIYYGDEVGMQGYTDPLNRKFFTWDNINDEVYSWYRNLSQIRSSYSLFADGDFKEIFTDEGIIIYKIVKEKDEIMVAINISSKEIEILFNGVLTELFTGKKYKNFVKLHSKSFGLFVNQM